MLAAAQQQTCTDTMMVDGRPSSPSGRSVKSCPNPIEGRPGSPSMRSVKSCMSSSNPRGSRSGSRSKRRLDSSSNGGNDNNGSRRRRQRRTSKRTSDKPQQQQQPQQQRKVTFEVDEKNRVKTHVRRIRKNQETINKRNGEPVLWWSQEELEQIMEREQNVFEVFSKCCTSYVDTVLKLWEHCETNNNNKEVDEASSMDMEKLANAPARGMENDLVVSFNPGSRDKAIQCVMKTQRAMSRANLEVRTSTMRRRYRNLSRASAEFAKNIADGDARVAAAILGQ